MANQQREIYFCEGVASESKGSTGHMVALPSGQCSGQRRCGSSPHRSRC